MRFDIFKNYVLGQGIELSDKSNIFQCFDLAYAYCLFLRIPKSTIQHLYAYQIFTSPNDLTNDYFQILPNTSDFVPQEGDIGVFNKTDSNIAGHVCICTGVGDTKSFKSLDQNWAGQSRVVEVTHNYVNFLGVLRPKPEAPLMTDQTLLPIIDENGNQMEIGAVRSRLNDWGKKISEYEKQIADLKLTVASLNSRITTLENISTQQPEVPNTAILTPDDFNAQTNPNPTFFQSVVGWIRKTLGI